jgi:Fe-S-cluster containining protein
LHASGVAFSAQQVQDLVKSIEVLASALATQQTARPTQPINNQVRPERPERPRIDLNSTEGKWEFFKNEWALYKRRASLPASCPEELRACCSEELRQELFNYIGPSTIDVLNEPTLLDHIRRLAVKGRNKAVHRQQFYTLHQDPDTPAHQFVAQLRAKAEHCNFIVKCANCDENVSYASPMISDQLTVGLADKDIQGEILAKDTQLNTFDDKLNLVQALEDGKRAKEQLSMDTTVAAHQSTYRKQQKHQPGNSNVTRSTCSGCGSKDHGKGTGKSRGQHCPAFSHKCEHCGIMGHLSSVCRKKPDSGNIQQGTTAPQQAQATRNNTFANEDSDNATWFLSYGCMDEFTHSSLMTNKAAWRSRNHPLSKSSKTQERFIIPHMEWTESMGRFAHCQPYQYLCRSFMRLMMHFTAH